MQIAQLAYHGLAAFGTAKKSQTLKQFASYALAESLLSVFFIILAVAVVVMIAASLLPAAVGRISPLEEKTAYLPGQYVSQQINQHLANGGYLSR